MTEKMIYKNLRIEQIDNILFQIIEKAREIWAYCFEDDDESEYTSIMDFCIQDVTDSCIVFGSCNRVIWTSLRGFRTDDRYCSENFVKRFNEYMLEHGVDVYDPQFRDNLLYNHATKAEILTLHNLLQDAHLQAIVVSGMVKEIEQGVYNEKQLPKAKKKLEEHRERYTEFYKKYSDFHEKLFKREEK